MEAHSTRTSIITTTKSVLQEKLYILTTNMLLDTIQIYGFVFCFPLFGSCIEYIFLRCPYTWLLCLFYNQPIRIRPSKKRILYLYCTMTYQIRKSLALSFFLVDQSIGITVYSYSIWQHSKNYHKDRHNPICFSCYVVTIPVQREMFNDNRWVN
jgi:hypothetical protein